MLHNIMWDDNMSSVPCFWVTGNSIRPNIKVTCFSSLPASTFEASLTNLVVTVMNLKLILTLQYFQ